MRRILVVGNGGAGKSTFSRRLGAALGLPVVHMDIHFWRPGWTEPEGPEWDAAVARLVEAGSWIMDGNYAGSLGPRVEAADAAVLLDTPRLLCVLRILKRRLQAALGAPRPDLPAGCPESIDLAFLRWVWRYERDTRPEVLRKLSGRGDGKPVYVLKGRRGVEAFLREAAGGRFPSPPPPA